MSQRDAEHGYSAPACIFRLTISLIGDPSHWLCPETMILPGLSRISRLLSHTALPWRAIHVAGTNGKGSICNYISSMLEQYSVHGLCRLTKRGPIRWGKFTSPHLVDRWDCISLNGRIISSRNFHNVEASVLERNATERIGASEFEILTATAFEIFSREKVDVGIVEVGMGGRLDATNVLGQEPEAGVADGYDPTTFRARPLVTAVSKIGLDHQAFLGNTIEDIAGEKAGIMKPGVPVVYDQSNSPEVKAVLDAHATGLGVRQTTFNEIRDLTCLLETWSYLPLEERPDGNTADGSGGLSNHRKHNTSVALRATWLALSQLGRLRSVDVVPDEEFNQALGGMARDMQAVSESSRTRNHGRLEILDLSKALDGAFGGAGGGGQVLLDGAHNAQSAEVLGHEVERLRECARCAGKGTGVAWVLGASEGRNVEELLRPLLRPGDAVFAVEFGPVAGMPWVKPVAACQILEAAGKVVNQKIGTAVDCGRDIPKALNAAIRHRQGLTVIAGSLYLVGDVHRHLRSVGESAG